MRILTNPIFYIYIYIYIYIYELIGWQMKLNLVSSGFFSYILCFGLRSPLQETNNGLGLLCF